ncbi:MAG: tetratricopeptide repeat protein [Dolichospermum sp.]
MIGMGNFEANKLYNKGYDALDLGNYKEAIYWFDQCLKLTPYDAEAWTNKGLSLVFLKQTNEALICFDQAIKIQPNNIDAWKCKGECLTVDLDRNEEALECYKKVLILDPNNYETWNNQGFSLLKLNRISEAKISFEMALKIKPDHPSSLKNLSRINQLS